MSSEPGMRRAQSLLVLLATIAVVPLAAAGPDAEYALRWKSTEGGPATLDQAAELLGVGGPPAAYSIRYFAAKAAPNAASAVPILRERQGRKTDVTWKYRSTAGWADLPDGDWCPLVGRTKQKDELDVTLLEGGATRQVYSRSCTAKTGLGTALPAALVGAQRGCTATMTRREAADEGITIEAWKLPGEEAVILEVSRKGADSAAALAAFRDDVADKLIAAGVRPIDRSKTELGTECH